MNRAAKCCLMLLLFLIAAGMSVCPPVQALQIYHVTNRKDSGPGSFSDCLSQSETDGEPSLIVFDVRGGTIYRRQRFNLTAGNLTVCGASVSPPGITFDFQGESSGFKVTSSSNRFYNLRITNTYTNSDGISIANTGSNVVERCTFRYCRDEAVGINGSSARNNIVAFCRIENCGSQCLPYTDGRGILITEGGSGVIVGNYISTSRSGVQCNSANSFMDIRNNLVESNFSNYGVSLSAGDGNIIDNVIQNNGGEELQISDGATFYRSGNIIDPPGQVFIGGGCTEVFAPISCPDTPFPSWLEGASTPTSAEDVGMETGPCQSLHAVSGTVIFEYPGWVQGTAEVTYQLREPGLPPTDPIFETTMTVSMATGYPASGSFTISDLPDGTYDVALKHYNRIADMVPDVVVAGSDVSGLVFTLWAGDGDGDDNVNTIYPDDKEGDNDVDLSDYYTLYYQYVGALPVTSGRNCDFNGDGNIDLADYYGLYYGYINKPNPGNWYSPVGNQPPIADAGPDRMVCVGDVVTFDGSWSYDPDDVPLTFDWNFGDGGTESGATTTYTYMTPGTYAVTLTVSDGALSDADLCIATVVVKRYYVSTSGNDSNPGTEAEPWRTIGKAAEEMVPGQVTMVAPGTYDEGQIHPAFSRLYESPITFQTDGDVTVNAASREYGFDLVGRHHIVIDGFEIINANQHGIYLGSGDCQDNSIKNCIIHDNSRSGVYCADAGPENQIINCLIYDNKWWGIYNVSGEITNCTVHGNGEGTTPPFVNFDGIRQLDAAAVVTDCIISSNDGYGINAGSDTAVTYSDVWGNNFGDYHGGVSAGAGCISADPLFVDPGSGDFHLGGGSPCIGAASDGGDMGYRY